jgi:hypothetical protein
MNIENIKQLFDIEVRYIDDIKGFGVFTNQFIPKSSIVEMCYSLKLVNTSLGHPSFDYMYYNPVNKNNYLPFGYGSIYNHSDTANLNWRFVLEEHNIIHFFSIRDIEIGEELTTNYGDGYWKNRSNKKKLI